MGIFGKKKVKTNDRGDDKALDRAADHFVRDALDSQKRQSDERARLGLPPY